MLSCELLLLIIIFCLIYKSKIIIKAYDYFIILSFLLTHKSSGKTYILLNIWSCFRICIANEVIDKLMVPMIRININIASFLWLSFSCLLYLYLLFYTKMLKLFCYLLFYYKQCEIKILQFHNLSYWHPSFLQNIC